MNGNALARGRWIRLNEVRWFWERQRRTMFRETCESDSPAIRNMPFGDGVIPARWDGSFLGARGLRRWRGIQKSSSLR